MLPDLGRLNIADTRAGPRSIGESDFPDSLSDSLSDSATDPRKPKRPRTDTPSAPLTHGRPLPNKLEWMNPKPSVSQPPTRTTIDPVNEYRAVESWKDEFRFDMMVLASEMTETLGAPESAFSMSSNTWTQQEWKYIRTLEEARKHQKLISPDFIPLRSCAHRAIKRLPLGLNPGQFLEMVEALKGLDKFAGVNFIFSAMPIEPVQGQYSLIDENKSGVVLFISNSSNTSDFDVRQQILGSVDAEQGSQLDKALVFNNDVFGAVRDIPMSGVGTKEGSSNIGSVVQQSDVEALHNAGLFYGIANALLNEGERDVISQMAYRTGIWKRTTKEEIQLRTRYFNTDDVYETYYTLRCALAGVSMPVYAIDINQNGNMVVLMESGISDLRDEGNSVDGIISRITSEVGNASIKRSIGMFLERRLASASLATGEIGLLLTDSKPGNFLFQKCYYQVDVPYKENKNLDLGILPVCVMATDIDPHYSFWFEHRQGVFLQQAVSPTKKFFGDLPLIDPQCVRYCNMAIFAMAAMCFGIESSWGIYMYNHCLIQANRYKNAKKDVSDGRVCLEVYYLQRDGVLKCYGRQLSSKDSSGEHLRGWGNKDSYDPEIVKGEERFNNFVEKLAWQVGERIRHYGMGRVGDGVPEKRKCKGPLRVADPLKAEPNLLGEVVAWMIEEANRVANPEGERVGNDATTEEATSSNSGTDPSSSWWTSPS